MYNNNKMLELLASTLKIVNMTLKVKKIIAGTFHTFIICTDGAVYACGSNKFGQLGIGDTKNRNIFTEVTILDKEISNVVAGGWVKQQLFCKF